MRPALGQDHPARVGTIDLDALPGRDRDGGGIQLTAQLRPEQVQHHPFRAALLSGIGRHSPGIRADPDSCHDALAVAVGGHARSMLQRQAICLGCAELPGAQHCPGGRQLQIRRFFALAHIVIAPEGVVRMARAMSNRGSRRLPDI